MPYSVFTVFRTALLFLFLGALPGSFLRAIQPYTPRIANPLSESSRWTQFPELDGTGIRCIAETPDRTVFVGCSKGVLEYNGYTWKRHRLDDNPDGLPVDQLLVATDGQVYATTPRGIFRYDGSSWESFFAVPDSRSFTFKRLKQLSDGSIIAGSSRGFLHFRPGRAVRMYSSAAVRNDFAGLMPDVEWIDLPAEALAANGALRSASDVLETTAGEVWFALTTDMEIGKLLRFRWSDVADGTVRRFEVVDSRGDFELGEDQQLLQAADGRIWVINSSSNKGVVIYDGKDWETIRLNSRFGGDEYMTDIVQSDNGIIWISSIAKVFSYFPDGRWETYKAPQFPIPANRVILQHSRSDQLWLAGYKSKLLLLDFSLDQWMTYEGLSFQFEGGGAQEQWFLEQNNRIVHREGDTWTSYGTEDGLMDAPVRMIRTSRGQIWAAGSHRGQAATAVLNDGHWQMQVHPALSWGIDYRAVFEARDGALWFGGSVDATAEKGFHSGLLELPDPTAEPLVWKHHVYGEDGLQQANAYGIGQSPDGRIWIGGSQLLNYDGARWQPQADERLQQFVNCVHTTDKLLLVGSRYYGVFVFDGREWTNYTTEDGLAGNTVISIDALSDTDFIVATENGICRFDGRSWTKDILPEELNLDFEGGTISHTAGYIWVDHVPRSWKRRAYHGESTRTEDYTLYTTRYRPSERPPETSVDFFMERVPADGNGLVSFAGTDHFGKTGSEQLMYSHRMDGGEWSAFMTGDEYTFRNLAGGDHRLEVRARDLDFNVDPTPAIVEFEVLLPIWKQPWFISLILTFLSIFGVYEYRVLSRNQKLRIVNASLQDANENLQLRGQKIAEQNREILVHQDQILQQSQVLEHKNMDLEERHAEIRLQHDKLEEMLVRVENLSKAKLGFFTNISHELRTPLTLILGPVARLLSESERMSAVQRQQLLSMVERNASRLLRLINQLLEIRRIEQSTLEIKLSDLRLPDYLSGIVELFDDLARRRDIELSFSGTPEAEPVVAIDADKVEKVVANLLSNAFRHTADGGSIAVYLTTVPAAARELNAFYEHYFEIRVEDTGSGISQDKIDLIFDKYYTSASANSDEQGAGIGLSYIKDLVYLMQGDIRVSSTLGEGSIFSVYLPLVASRAAVEPAAGPARLPFRVTREETTLLLSSYLEEAEAEEAADLPDDDVPGILVVEDNPDMLQFLVQLLQDTYRVVPATNGKAALRLARQQSFDLVVSDVMMSEMDGITFCEELKGHLATSHLPVILLTAKVLDENKVSGYLKGADDYITKPFNPDLLLVRIANLLQQRDQLRKKFTLDFRLTPPEERVQSPDEEFMERLINLMNENIGEAEFNVQAMCEAMNLSHMHFIRKVKQLTGKKPIDLLKSFRMKKAKDLLAQRSCTVAEVAYRVGFDLPNSFSRTFKKEFNQTPTEFMRQLPQEEEV